MPIGYRTRVILLDQSMKSLLMAVLTLTLMVGCKKSKIDVDDDNIGGADQQAVDIRADLRYIFRRASRVLRGLIYGSRA